MSNISRTWCEAPWVTTTSPSQISDDPCSAMNPPAATSFSRSKYSKCFSVLARASSSVGTASSAMRARCVLSDLTALPMLTAIGLAACRCCTTPLTSEVSA